MRQLTQSTHVHLTRKLSVQQNSSIKTKLQLLHLSVVNQDFRLKFCVHCFACGATKLDVEWLQTLPQKLFPRWFELRKCSRMEREGFTEVFNVYKFGEEFKTSTMMKIDDDIVCFPLGGAITKAVEHARMHPEASWTSALVLNNPVVDHCLQQDGVISLTKELNFTKLPRDEWDVLGVPTADDCRSVPKSLSALHDFFMSDPDHFHHLTGVNIVPPKCRVGLNVMFFAQNQVRRWKPRGAAFDEMAIRGYNGRNNVSVHLHRGAPAVHLNCGRQQRAGIVDDRFEKQHLDFACSCLGLDKDKKEECMQACVPKPWFPFHCGVATMQTLVVVVVPFVALQQRQTN
jgi:hypothetical protein